MATKIDPWQTLNEAISHRAKYDRLLSDHDALIAILLDKGIVSGKRELWALQRDAGIRRV